MIKSFRHKGLERLFREGSKAGIQPAHATRLRLQLSALDQAMSPQELQKAEEAKVLQQATNKKINVIIDKS